MPSSVGALMNGEAAPGMPYTGSVKMKPARRTRVLRWIGFICTYTGGMISILALPDDMLPINQALFVLGEFYAKIV